MKRVAAIVALVAALAAPRAAGAAASPAAPPAATLDEVQARIEAAKGELAAATRELADNQHLKRTHRQTYEDALAAGQRDKAALYKARMHEAMDKAASAQLALIRLQAVMVDLHRRAEQLGAPPPVEDEPRGERAARGETRGEAKPDAQKDGADKAAGGTPGKAPAAEPVARDSKAGVAKDVAAKGDAPKDGAPRDGASKEGVAKDAASKEGVAKDGAGADASKDADKGPPRVADAQGADKPAHRRAATRRASR
jgi:hypothetical protein